MWRQGDVLIQRVDSIPDGLEPIRRLIVAAGESSGKSHKIKDQRSARLFGRMERTIGTSQLMSELFLEVIHDTAELVHAEHGAILLPKGSYRVWRQREFTDSGSRSMID